jgi:hypothetical protein
VLTYPDNIGSAVLEYYLRINPSIKAGYTIKEPLFLRQNALPPPPFEFTDVEKKMGEK